MMLFGFVELPDGRLVEVGFEADVRVVPARVEHGHGAGVETDGHLLTQEDANLVLKFWKPEK
jgi:hypothetical protein